MSKGKIMVETPTEENNEVAQLWPSSYKTSQQSSSRPTSYRPTQQSVTNNSYMKSNGDQSRLTSYNSNERDTSI